MQNDLQQRIMISRLLNAQENKKKENLLQKLTDVDVRDTLNKLLQVYSLLFLNPAQRWIYYVR